MPKRDPREVNWVPTVARVLCYMCGVTFENENEKTNCRFCYDVFCPKCLSANPIALPPSYGYESEPQPVCVMCDHLVHAFPMFAAQIGAQAGGQLLDRRHNVLTVSTTEGCAGNTEGSVVVTNGSFAKRGSNPPTAKKKADTAPASDSNSGGGFFSSVKKLFGGSKDKDSKKGTTDNGSRGSTSSFRTSTSHIAATPKGQKALRACRATGLELHAWRPVSPDTALVCEGGDSRVYLRDVRSVEFREHVIVHLNDGRSIEFIVVQVQGETTGGKDDEFVVDASANYTLATGLASLIKICKSHFALNPSASFAMHRDVQEGATR